MTRILAESRPQAASARGTDSNRKKTRHETTMGNQSYTSQVLKSVNLQYNTLGRWNERLINQASDVPSIIIFFIIFAKFFEKILSIYFFITLQK